MEPNRKILIVEDEHINKELLKIFLEQLYDLTFAADYDTAVNFIDNQTFDLIITDIRLGNRLDGIALLGHVRNNAKVGKTPVVAYTASDTSINQKSFAEEGFDGFISKPVQQAELLAKVTALLEASK